MPNLANAYAATLAAGITSGATSCTVTTVSGLPALPCKLLIAAEGSNANEIVTVTAAAGTTLTISRATEALGGAAATSAHGTGAVVTNVITAGNLAALPLNVMDFGATGNGTTDDTAAINAAIAAAPAGAIVYFPPGTYRISSVISITGKMLTLQGPSGFSEGATLSQATANTGALSFDQTADNSTVRNLRLLGNGTQSSSSGLASQKSINCYDVRVEGFWNGFDIGSVGSFYSRLVDCFAFDNASLNIWLRPSTFNTLILGCRIHGNATTSVGIYLDSNNVSTRIISCSIEQHTADGVRIVGSASNTLDVAIRDCYFETAAGASQVRVGSTAVADAVTIDGCYFAAGTVANLWHINLANATNARVVGCYVGTSGAGGGSLTVGGGTSGIVLTGNDFAGTVALGVAPAAVVESGGTVYATGHAPVTANIGATTTVVCTTAGTWYKHTGWGDVPFVPAFAGQRWLIIASVTMQSNVATNIEAALLVDNATTGGPNAYQDIQQQNVPTVSKWQSLTLTGIFTAASGDVGANRYPYLYFNAGANATTVTLYGGAAYATSFIAVPIP